MPTNTQRDTCRQRQRTAFDDWSRSLWCMRLSTRVDLAFPSPVCVLVHSLGLIFHVLAIRTYPRRAVSWLPRVACRERQCWDFIDGMIERFAITPHFPVCRRIEWSDARTLVARYPSYQSLQVDLELPCDLDYTRNNHITVHVKCLRQNVEVTNTS